MKLSKVVLVGLVGCSLAASPKKSEADEVNEAMAIADKAAATDAQNAHQAAATAKEAASVATKVARHSIKMTEHAKSALKNSLDAVNRARVETSGLSVQQKRSLKLAESKLREATKDADYGSVREAKYVKAEASNKKLEKMDKKMDVIKEKQSLDRFGKSHKKDADSSELEEMRKELDELRKQLKAKGQNEDDEAIEELEKQIEEMEKAEKKDDKADSKSHDEMKAEIERLREMIKKLKKSEKRKIPPLAKAKGKKVNDAEEQEEKAVRVEKSLDIDTAMPYGDLEPFGREDTAQELTEASIRESDGMVDQLERAEVAEEKRAVFRALTRLRGAAITSFDGVARSQTGNIDEYNKINQWRSSHPLHHLADEESDVSKWAFPDNAD